VAKSSITLVKSNKSVISDSIENNTSKNNLDYPSWIPAFLINFSLENYLSPVQFMDIILRNTQNASLIRYQHKKLSQEEWRC
jgi:hypothetical protein